MIKDGAKVDAEKEVIVEATSNQFDFLMAVAGGKAEKFGFEGAGSYANQDSLTLAQIESGAVITGGDLSVKAKDTTNHINVTGGVVVSQNVGVGASVGINEIDRDVYAVIGTLPSAEGGPWEVTFNQNGHREAIAAIPATDADLFNGTLTPATISEGALGVRELQKISHDATQGEFTLTFEGETTSPLAYNATAEEVGLALNALETIQNAGGVYVTGGEGGSWEIRFDQAGNRDEITAAPGLDFNGDLDWSTEEEGEADVLRDPADLQQRATQGSFSLSFEGEKTAPLAYNASVDEVASALNALEAIKNAGGVTVEGGNGTWNITFSEPGDWEQITCRAEAAFNGDLIPSTIREGDTGTRGLQRIDNNSTDGTFRLSFGGETTGPIAHNASAADVEKALNALASIQAAGGVKVTAAPGGDPGSDTVNVSGDVLLDATSDGQFLRLLPGGQRPNQGRPKARRLLRRHSRPMTTSRLMTTSGSPLDGETLPALFGDAEGAPTDEPDPDKPGENKKSEGQGKTGIGIAGDVSINTVTDSALAYINDRGKFTADSFTLSTLNETDLIAASGAAAISTGGIEDKTSAGHRRVFLQELSDRRDEVVHPGRHDHRDPRASS